MTSQPQDLWLYVFDTRVGQRGQLQKSKALQFKKEKDGFSAEIEEGASRKSVHSDDGWRLNQEEAIAAAIEGIEGAIKQTESMIINSEQSIVSNKARIARLRSCIEHAKEIAGE